MLPTKWTRTLSVTWECDGQLVHVATRIRRSWTTGRALRNYRGHAGFAAGPGSTCPCSRLTGNWVKTIPFWLRLTAAFDRFGWTHPTTHWQEKF